MSDDRIALSEVGASALENVALTLPNCVEDIAGACGHLVMLYEQYEEILGPHTNQIREILETIRAVQNGAKEATTEVAGGLASVAQAIREVVGANF